MTDPARLRSHARALRQHADRLHRLSRAVGGLVEVRWRGAASERFRQAVLERCTRLARAEDEVHDAASLLEVHARALEEDPP